jgi:mannan polymerase II complex MNN11 subunit
MHFAYTRKSSNPPPFRPRSTRIPTLRRFTRPKTLLIGGIVILFLIWLFSGSGSSSSGSKGNRSSHVSPKHAITGKPPVVIVTVIDERIWGDSPEYLKSIKENRERYAEKHGEFYANPISRENLDAANANAICS